MMSEFQKRQLPHSSNIKSGISLYEKLSAPMNFVSTSIGSAYPNSGKDRQRLSGDGIGQAEYFAGGADSFRSGQRN